MKHILITIAAVVLVGCATTKQQEPPTAKAPDISIHEAAAKGNIEAVNQHLEVGADVNARENNKWTPLHYAAGHGHKEITEILITKRADVNAKGFHGRTPLHEAAARIGDKEFTELLIDNGADVNAKDEDGRTPLDLANKTETADLLRKHGGKTGEELKGK